VTGAAAYDYARMFDGTQIRRADMPCLALFTDAQAHRAAIVPLPDWSPDDLWTLLQSICDTIDDCAGEADPEQRLQRLQRELASFPARASRTLGHLAGKAAEYAKAHPVQVVTVTLNVAVAMATAGLIPIGATAVTFIKDLLGIIKDA
jgi:hypothetical protein